MQWLCNHEDQNMQRMAVAIISILAAKVPELQWLNNFLFPITATISPKIYMPEELVHLFTSLFVQATFNIAELHVDQRF